MSATCKDCKHWGSEDPDVPGHHICELTVNEGMMDFKHPDSKAVATGTGFSSSARLITKPDFGCVQFRAVSGRLDRGE